MAETEAAQTAHTTHSDHGTSRRAVLRGAVVAGVAAPFLAACSSNDSSGSPSSPSTPPSSAGGGSTSSSDGGGGAVATTSEIPEGGGIILADAKVVITQPAAGQFKAFSAICTHLGCTVSKVVDGTIDCPCHGSMYSIKDGSVVGGPAPMPLPPQQIKVTGSDITLA